MHKQIIRLSATAALIISTLYSPLSLAQAQPATAQVNPVGHVKPAEAAKPATAEAAKPAAPAPAKPATAEVAKPAVPAPAKPATAEAAKPAAPEPAKPAPEELKNSAAVSKNVNVDDVIKNITKIEKENSESIKSEKIDNKKAPGMTVDMVISPEKAKSDKKKISFDPSVTVLTIMASIFIILATLVGFSMFYSGMVRSKNAVSPVAQVFAGFSIVSVLWIILGYSLSFRGEMPYIGDFSAFLLDGMYPTGGTDANKIINAFTSAMPETGFILFQMTLAALAGIIAIGAVVERVKFFGMLIFFALWTILVYVPMAHGIMSPAGWFKELAGLDWAGALPVHLAAGAAALAGAIILGARNSLTKESILPRSVTIAVPGAGVILAGLLAVNIASALNIDNGLAIWAALTSLTSAAAGAIVWLIVEGIVRRYSSSLGIASGAIIGMIAISPSAGYVSVSSAFLIGAVASLATFFFITLKSKLKIDDALDVFAIHAVPAAIGAIFTAIFAITGLTPQNTTPILISQIIGVVVVLAYSFIVSSVIFGILKKIGALRVSEEEEKQGLDILSHGEIQK